MDNYLFNGNNGYMAYKQNFGRMGEDIAVNYLVNHGFRLIDRNFRSKFGEIDIIAEKNKKIFFVEVKTRANLNKGKPYEAINYRKASQLRKTATYFLLKNKMYKKYRHTIGVFSILLESRNIYKLRFFETID